MHPLWLLIIFANVCAYMTPILWADSCCRSLELALGWRRDCLDWNVSPRAKSGMPGRARSHLLFEDIESYTLSGKARWAGSAYYLRLAAEYGLTDKGRAQEHFHLNSPMLYGPVAVSTSDPVKRRSEVYEFNGAVGYPFSLCGSRLSLVPLIGFSFHRQHWRVKADQHDCSPSSSFAVCGCSPFLYDCASNPFADSSTPQIAGELGLCTHHRSSNYRFTWYGFYLGVDGSYALDDTWTLFVELECHGLNRCHRKRASWTGVSRLDDQHATSWAYGFKGLFGAAYYLVNYWYGLLSVEVNWWKSEAKRNDLEWKTVGTKIGIGYLF